MIRRVFALLPACLLGIGGALPAQADVPIRVSTVQTSAEAHAQINRLALSGAITLFNGTDDGARVMVRPVTGIRQSSGCMTDFAAVKATRLAGWTSAADHMTVYWSEVDELELEPQAIRFHAPWVWGQDKARLLIPDGAARSAVWEALNVLVRNCGGAAARKRGPAPGVSNNGETTPSIDGW